MAFFKLPAPDIGNVSLGGADLHLLECYGFTSDERYMVVRGTFTDASDNSFGLHYGFWLFDTQTREYTSNLNAIIAGDDNAREIDVLDLQFSDNSGDLFAVALVEDKGTGHSYLVSVLGDQIISSDVIQNISGQDIDVKVEAISLSADGRFLAVQTSSEQLAPELAPDTNDSSDVYLFDLLNSSVDRVSYVGGSEVTDPTYLKDIRVKDDSLQIAFVTDAAFVSPSKKDRNSSEVSSQVNSRSDLYIWSSDFDESGLVSSESFDLVSVDQDGFASGFVGKSNIAQITERGVFFTSSSDNIVTNDNNSANDVYFSSVDGNISGVTNSGPLFLDSGSQFVSASDSGQYAAFLSASPEISGNTGAQQLAIIDLDSNETEVSSQNGELSNDWVINGVVSNNGLSTAFTSNADNLSSIEPQTTAGDLYANITESIVASGAIYHWRSHALLDGVDVSISNATIGSQDSLVTEANEGVSFSDPILFLGEKEISIDRSLTPEDQSRVITSLDALSAIKIAVGLNPNSDGTALSPYQLIAADVNQDGVVSSRDALEIIKMAVGLSDAIPQQWLFVNESEDFWDEDAGVLSLSKSNVDWQSEVLVFTDPSAFNFNYAGVLLGDVNGSWSPPAESEILDNSYFIALEGQGLGPADQWFAFPLP
jgi:hypothetical protein